MMYLLGIGMPRMVHSSQTDKQSACKHYVAIVPNHLCQHTFFPKWFVGLNFGFVVIIIFAIFLSALLQWLQNTTNKYLNNERAILNMVGNWFFCCCCCHNKRISELTKLILSIQFYAFLAKIKNCKNALLFVKQQACLAAWLAALHCDCTEIVSSHYGGDIIELASVQKRVASHKQNNTKLGKNHLRHSGRHADFAKYGLKQQQQKKRALAKPTICSI